MLSSSTSALAPGFRFHPTDEELVGYYLKRKVSGKTLRFDAISEIDIYRSEPWDLPNLSRLKSRDLEWYFFSGLDKKHGHGSRTNRATEQGYWKTTGKDRPVRRHSRTVGMKKTLVFHIGRAPRGERTNWVMHEYRLEDPELGQASVPQDALVLCRIFQKSGSGPKNGEQYGAPLVEEEWDDDDLLIPTKDSSGDGYTDAVFDSQEWGYVHMNDLEENLDMGIQYEDVAPMLGFSDHNGYNNLKDAVGLIEGIDDQKFLNDTCQDDDFPKLSGDEEFFDGLGVESNLLGEQVDQYFLSINENTNSTESDQTYPLVKDEHYVELNAAVNPMGPDYPAGEVGDDGMMYFDAPAHNQLPIEDESFLELKDLLNRDEAEASGFEMLDEFLMCFDATNDNLQHVPSDSSLKLSERVDVISDPLILAAEVSVGTVQASLECPQAPKAPGAKNLSSLLPKPEASCGSRDKNNDVLVADDTLASDVQYKDSWDKSVAKHFSSMLGSIPSPPAFAVEYSTKGSLKSVGQNSATNQSTSVHVSAGMFLISELRITEGGQHLSLQKAGDVGFLSSYGMGGDVMASKCLNGYSDSFEIITEASAKATSVMWQAGFYLGLLWVLILAVSFKVGSYIYTR